MGQLYDLAGEQVVTVQPNFAWPLSVREWSRAMFRSKILTSGVLCLATPFKEHYNKYYPFNKSVCVTVFSIKKFKNVKNQKKLKRKRDPSAFCNTQNRQHKGNQKTTVFQYVRHEILNFPGNAGYFS
jgi:hypothetical protein